MGIRNFFETYSPKNHFGPIWATMGPLGHFRPIWVSMGPLGHFGPIWATMGHWTHSWSNEQARPTMDTMGPFGQARSTPTLPVDPGIISLVKTSRQKVEKLTKLWIIKCVCPYMGISDFLHTGYGFKNLLASDSWHRIRSSKSDKNNRNMNQNVYAHIWAC